LYSQIYPQMYPPVSVQGTATKDIPNCSSVTYLPTAVTESCIDARQLFCEKAMHILAQSEHRFRSNVNADSG